MNYGQEEEIKVLKAPLILYYALDGRSGRAAEYKGQSGIDCCKGDSRMDLNINQLKSINDCSN